MLCLYAICIKSAISFLHSNNTMAPDNHDLNEHFRCTSWTNFKQYALRLINLRNRVSDVCLNIICTFLKRISWNICLNFASKQLPYSFLVKNLSRFLQVELLSRTISWWCTLWIRNKSSILTDITPNISERCPCLLDLLLQSNFQ